MTKRLADAMAPLMVYYGERVRTLTAEQQEHIDLQVVAEATDSGERIGLRAQGAQLQMQATVGAGDVVFRAESATMCAFLQHSGREFIVGPIMRGRLSALRSIRGTLRMCFTEGDEMTICFGDAASPEAVIRLSHADAIGLFNGKLRPEVGVMMGRIRIESGLAFLLSLERIL